MNPIADEILMHYGTPRRSGRYPWGSGDNSYQHNTDFLGRIEQLKKQGWTETPENIKKEFGLTTTQYRAQKGIANNERRTLLQARIKSLKEDGLNNTEIGRKMGLNESSVRSLLNEQSEARMNKAKNTADFLKKQVDEKGMIDVGAGVERELNVSREKLNQSLKILEKEGYHTFGGRVDQATNPGQKTTIKVLCPPGTEHKEIYNYENVKTINEYVSHDNGNTFDKYVYPKSIDSKRVKILLADEVGPSGTKGIEKDGLIEIRRGVKDLSLGNDRYAQVRILVDGDKYLKGMAVYSDNLPDGVDVLFNSNKTSAEKGFKKIKDDPDNPFGALIKPGGQSYYIDNNGNRQLSAINKTREEGDWSDWKDALPSQFLSKQSLYMAKKQLNLAATDKMAELDEINSLTNPTVKKHYLASFAEDCDAAAVHLQAAALPGQKYHVIIPIPSMKDTEVYAPRYDNGTKLALIRYPHGGTFEIPILTVNNKQVDAKKLIGTDSFDAVGINKKVADRLSGADFDGDTVMCIPTHDKAGKVRIRSRNQLEGLVGFDPSMAYPEVPGMKIMKNTQTEMGKISNLITDMTLQGAPDDELAAAVRHSMVVIDAEKHRLNYKQSEVDNNISALKKKWQIKVDENGNTRYGGAGTLISRAKGEVSVIKRQGSPKINIKGEPWYDPNKPEGSLIYKNADDAEYTVTKVNKKTGEITTKTKYRHQQSTKMRETDDAYTLISQNRTQMEIAYADYANKMKSLANQARKEMVSTGKVKYSAQAKATYQEEVESIEAKLNIALLNAPRERRANLLTASEVQKRKLANPDMTNEEIRKLNQRLMTKNRSEVGGVSRRNRSIKITDREWEAIQAGAISETKLKQILANTDPDVLRQKALPKTTKILSQAKVNRIKSLSASNYTVSEIASKLGVSPTTISEYLKGEKR